MQRPPRGMAFEFDQALLLMVNILTMDTETLTMAIAAERVEPPSPQFTLDTAVVLQKAIMTRRGDYRTSINEDGVLLQNGVPEIRHRMATEVRLGDKEILAWALDTIETKIRTLTLEAPLQKVHDRNADGFRNKRRKF